MSFAELEGAAPEDGLGALATPTSARLNACSAAPDAVVTTHCVLCGRVARGWAALPLPSPVVSHLRCEACYQLVLPGALYCGHCGRRAVQEHGGKLRAGHASAGRLCAEALGDLPGRPVALAAADTERGLQPVREVGTFFAAMLAPILLMYGWSFHVGKPSLTFGGVGAALFYGVIAYFAWQNRRLVRPVLLTPPRRPLFFAGIVALTPLFTLGVIGALSLLKGPVFSDGEFKYSDELLEAGYGWWAVYGSVAVLPAVFEEIAFRGVIMKKLESVMPPSQALWVTALLFAIIHYNVLGLVIFLVPLAWVAGWTVQKSGSLWPAILIHFLHNAGIVLSEQLTP